MGFKLKTLGQLLGLNEQTSTRTNPVFEKQLGKNIRGEANRDGTIFVDKGLSQKEINKTVAHEKVHMDQMARGDLYYDNTYVYWKGKKYKRSEIKEGSKNLPWEKEAYKKTKK
tara:strand:+ start:188 stop:526 length:339 start_codon:yes stop_codon:yes gene_type:complete